MATGVFDAYRNNDFQNPKGFGYGCFFRGRKIACKSKSVQQITVKKSVSRHISFQRDEEILKEVAQVEKKRKVVIELLKKDSPISSPESGEFIPSDDPRKRLEKDSPLSSPESGEFIPSDGSRKRRKKEEECGMQIPKRRSRDVISGCGSVDEYESLNVISRGAYGIVYRARNKKTGEIVAMKEEFHGLSIPSLREIDILKSLPRHPSIIEFKQVVVDDCDGVYIVMEYLEYDLKRFMDARKSHFTLNQVKHLMKQLLESVKFLHHNGVMHRDLKPSNILINNRGKLKICDFGLSRHFGSISGSYSPNVVTLWYRAPELLLGAKSYSSAIDMWSVGCIMGELVLKAALFRGQSEIEQLQKIYRVVGTPDEASNLLRQKFSLVGGIALLTEDGFDLLNRLLSYDPARRITAESALNHAWFKEY